MSLTVFNRHTCMITIYKIATHCHAIFTDQVLIRIKDCKYGTSINVIKRYYGLDFFFSMNNNFGIHCFCDGTHCFKYASPRDSFFFLKMNHCLVQIGDALLGSFSFDHD